MVFPAFFYVKKLGNVLSLLAKDRTIITIYKYLTKTGKWLRMKISED